MKKLSRIFWLFEH